MQKITIFSVLIPGIPKKTSKINWWILNQNWKNKNETAQKCENVEPPAPEKNSQILKYYSKKKKLDQT